MRKLSDIIRESLTEIQEVQGYPLVEPKDEASIKEMGFTRLDLSELIASLEMELGVDPFAAGTSIKAINTVGELIQAYRNQLSRLQPAF